MIHRSQLRAAARGPVRTLAYFLVGGWGLVYRLWKGWPGQAPGEAPRRILVIRLDLLGDLILTMPAVLALRRAYPSARICILTLPYTAPLARLYPEVDEVIEVDTNRIRTLSGLLSIKTWRSYLRTGRYLRRQRFDLCLSVSGRMASLCAFLSGARWTLGYRAEAFPFLLTQPLPGGRYQERDHEVEYVRRLAAAAGVGPPPDRLSLPVPPDALQAARTLLARHGVGEGERFVVIHPGAGNGAAKRWPPECWSALGGELLRRAGAHAVLIGGASDQPIAAAVLRRAPGGTVSLVGETDLPTLAGILALSDLVATGDSGPLHMAVALGRPVLTVFGPTDPTIYGPYRPAAAARVLRRDLPCSPCYTAAVAAECPLGDPICMRLVTVQEMVEAAMDVLDGLDRPSGAANNPPASG